MIGMLPNSLLDGDAICKFECRLTYFSSTILMDLVNSGVNIVAM